MKRLFAAALVCSAVLGAAACSSSGSPKDKATKAAGSLCSDLTALRGDAAKLKAMDPATATKDQVTNAVDAVKKDWGKVSDDSGDLSQAKKDGIKKSVDDLRSAYDGLDGGTSGKEALQKLQPQINEVRTTVGAAMTAVKC